MKVRVTRTATVTATPTGNVHYEEGYVGLAPRAHIERLEAAGAGKRLTASELKQLEAEDKADGKTDA